MPSCLLMKIRLIVTSSLWKLHFEPDALILTGLVYLVEHQTTALEWTDVSCPYYFSLPCFEDYYHDQCQERIPLDILCLFVCIRISWTFAIHHWFFRAWRVNRTFIWRSEHYFSFLVFDKGISNSRNAYYFLLQIMCTHISYK